MAADYDVLVIGGGAAGIAAAREAARRQARTLLVHEGPLGGVSTHTGDVPTAALLGAATRGLPYSDAIKQVQTAIATVERSTTAATLRSAGIDTRRARAEFVEPGTVAVDGTQVSPPTVVIATGTRSIMPDIPGLAAADPLNAETLWEMQRRPERLVVLGGGPTGCEYAQAFQQFGAQVTIIEASARLLGREEPEASSVVQRVLARDGIDIELDAHVTRVEPDGAIGYWVHLDGGKIVEATRALVAVGREPVIDPLRLDRAGIHLRRGYVATDDTLQTSVDGVYAAGDVTGKFGCTNAAAEMGRLAAANGLSRVKQKFATAAVPDATFTDPEVAHVGLTEAQAAAQGGQVAYLPLTEVDRAVAEGATDGFVKLIASSRRMLRDPSGARVLGATIVAPTAGEMINEIALAIRTNVSTARLARTVAVYPSWSSAISQAAAQFAGVPGGRTARPARAG